MEEAQEQTHVEHLYKAVKLAREFVRSTIECECQSRHFDGATWWDTEPMLNKHEHSPAVVDLNTELITWGCASGILLRHPHKPQHVKVIHTP